MADYPDAIFALRAIENLPGITYDANNTKAFYAEDLENVAGEVTAIETALGTDLSEVQDMIDASINARRALDYPVGKIYISESSTNPGTVLGFGTWVAYGAGRVLVSLDSGDTEFDTPGETRGSKTVASDVEVATQPTFTTDPHNHVLSDNGWAYVTLGTSAGAEIAIRRQAVGDWVTTHDIDASAAGAANLGRTTGTELGGATDDSTDTATTRIDDVELTNNATSVVQPSIVVYMFKRTA